MERTNDNPRGQRGKIVSVARAEPSADAKLQYGLAAQPKRGHLALELEITGEMARQSPSEIASQYRVDTKARKLTAAVKRG